MNELNWKELWKDPFKILDLITLNEKSTLQLELIKKRLKAEIKKELKIKKGGYVFEKERKDTLVNEVKKIDGELADKISSLDDKDSILSAFDARIKEIRIIIKNSEGELKKVLKEQKQTLGSANKIVERYIKINNEIKEIYRKQITNRELNDLYESRLHQAIETKQLENKLDHFLEEAKKFAERTIEIKTLQGDVIDLMKEINELKQKALGTQEKFEEETEEIGKIKKIYFKIIRRKAA